MVENLRKLFFVFIYFIAFSFSVVLSVPADAVSDGWVKLLGTASLDCGSGVVADSAGNIYITGYTKGNLGGESNAGGEDIFLAKYDGSGTRQWVKLLGTDEYDRGLGVATDSSGNIYVTGDTLGNLGSQTNAGGYDIFVWKHSESFPWEIFLPAILKKNQ